MSPGAVSVASSDTDLLVKLGLDPREFQSGAAVINDETRKMDDQLKKTGTSAGTFGRGMDGASRTSRIMSRDMVSLGNSLYSVAGASGASSREMMLLGNAMNIAQSAALGLVNVWGLVLTAVAVGGVALVQYIRSLDDTSGAAELATKKMREMAKATETWAKETLSGLRAVGAALVTEKDVFVQAENDLQAMRDARVRALKELFALTTDGVGNARDLTEEEKKQAEALRETNKAIEIRIDLLEKEITAARLRNAIMANQRQAVIDLAKTLTPAGDEPVPSDTAPRPRTQDPQRIKQAAKQQERAVDSLIGKTNELAMALSSNISQGIMTGLLRGEEAFKQWLVDMAEQLIASVLFKLLLNLFSPASIIPIPAGDIPVFQAGTSYVPRTGMAYLHRGEAVIPASQNIYNTSTRTTNAGLTIENVTVLGVTDVPSLVKQIESLARQRRSSLALVG